MSNSTPNAVGNGGPDSDLLLSDAASDGGISYADSPADGYFRERSHPRDVFVQNPSMEQGGKAGDSRTPKADNSVSGQYSQMSSPAASLRSRSYSVESLPMLDAGPAPPDYAAATAHRTELHQTAPYRDNVTATESLSDEERTSYGSMDDSRRHPASVSAQPDHSWPFGNTNSPFGRGFPFANDNNPFGPGFPFSSSQGPHADDSHHTEPADRPREMSDRVQPRDDSLEDTVLLRWNRQPEPKRKSRTSRSPCKLRSFVKAVVAIVLVIVVIWIARALTKSDGTQGGDGNKGGGGRLPNGPGNGDNLHKSPQTPNLPSQPHPPSPSCPLGSRTDTVAFKFQSLKHFLFVETVEKSTEFKGNIKGNLYIRPAQDDQDSDIVLWVSVGISSPWQVTSLNFIQTDSSYVLNMPNLSQNAGAYSKSPCMEINAWIDVRKGVNLEDLGIDTTYLNIIVEEGLVNPDANKSEDDIRVENLAAFSSVAGDISSVYWSSRRTIVRTVSGNIAGQFALLDKLGLYSSSGDVKVDVDPKEADRKNPARAEFTAETVSGNIHANFPLTGTIPEREYTTRVETTSANILGSYIHGRESTFQSTSGNIKVKLLPCYYSDEDTSLQTSSFSGNTDVMVLSPYKRAGTPWGQLHHSGDSTSGNLLLAYPPEWEGKIGLSTMTGDISVSGKVRKIVEDENPWSHRYVGEKGTGGGELGFETTTGNMRISVGS